MSVTSLRDVLEKKNGKVCGFCSTKHDPNGKCDRAGLMDTIKKLHTINRSIPQLIENGKQAYESAIAFQKLLKKADEAHAILMNILATFGDIGEAIRKEYMEQLESWAKGKPTNQDTSEQQELFSQDQLISNATEINASTKQQSGEALGVDS